MSYSDNMTSKCSLFDMNCAGPTKHTWMLRSAYMLGLNTQMRLTEKMRLTEIAFAYGTMSGTVFAHGTIDGFNVQHENHAISGTCMI